MPELPEVETVKCGIMPLIGQQIEQVVLRHNRLRYPLSKQLPEQLLGQKIIAINRRAKYLLLILERGFLLLHLGMSGSLQLIHFKQAIPLLKKHDHVDIATANFILRYNDPRRFGCIVYYRNLQDCSLLAHLGVEPLAKQFSAKYLLSKIANKSSTIKQLIMDNHLVVGIGNIYACEALFLARIMPTRSGLSITDSEAKQLVAAIKKILKCAIDLGGSSLRDYKRVDGNLGNFQTIHNVYAKAGRQCKNCHTPIVAVRLGGRNSFYCPTCQI